jgi:hypothetical protein
VLDRKGTGCSMKERFGGGKVLRADGAGGPCYRDRRSATATGVQCRDRPVRIITSSALEDTVFGLFKKLALALRAASVTDTAREQGYKGVCTGCSCPIKGQFLPATWRGQSKHKDKSRIGTLFACRCPCCGVELLAWEPSKCDLMNGSDLYWNMHAVQTHYGELRDCPIRGEEA